MILLMSMQFREDTANRGFLIQMTGDTVLGCVVAALEYLDWDQGANFLGVDPGTAIRPVRIVEY